jgi:hypothetical protein
MRAVLLFQGVAADKNTHSKSMQDINAWAHNKSHLRHLYDKRAIPTFSLLQKDGTYDFFVSKFRLETCILI